MLINFLDGSKREIINLIGANLIGANLIGANLIGAKLIGAKLSGAKLSRADLSYLKMRLTLGLLTHGGSSWFGMVPKSLLPRGVDGFLLMMRGYIGESERTGREWLLCSITRRLCSDIKCNERRYHTAPVSPAVAGTGRRGRRSFHLGDK